MPDDKPSSAPDELKPTDDLTAAAVLNDDDTTPGGGGMMGAGARTSASTGGTAPNAPIDVPTPDAADRDGAAEGESVAAAGEDVPEPGHTSQ